MTKTIRIEDFDERPEAELALSGGVVLQLRCPSVRPSLEPSWAARRPGWGNARVAADRLLAASIVGPVGAPVLAELSEYERRRLIVAVADLLNAGSRWRGLYGTTLSAEERLIAIVVDARRREAAEVRHRLIEMRSRIAERAAGTVTPGIAKRLTATSAIGKAIAGFSSINRSLSAFKGIDRTLGVANTPSRLLGIGAHETALSKMLKGNTGLVGLDYKAPSVHAEPPLARLASGLRGIGSGTTIERGFGLGDLSRLTEIFGKQTLAGVNPNPASAHLTGDTARLLGRIAGKSVAAYGVDPSIPGARFGISADARSALDALFAARNASTIAGVKGIGASLDFNRFGFQHAGTFDIGGQWRRTLDALLLAEFARVWGGHALWFLLRDLTPAEVRKLIDRDPREIHAAVLDALERVLHATPVLDAIEMALAELAFLDAHQREWLQDGLDHLRHGNWVKSLPPLILGFEGAIYSGALAAEALTVTRGKELAAEAVIKAIDLDEALRSFTIRLVFGGRGNAIRHGRPKNEAREQALLVVVAIVGWVDSVLGSRGAERLVQEIRGPLLKGLETSKATRVLESA